MRAHGKIPAPLRASQVGARKMVSGFDSVRAMAWIRVLIDPPELRLPGEQEMGWRHIQWPHSI